MKIPAHDVALFYKLYPSLLAHANQKLNVIPDVETPEEIMALPLDDRAKLRKALWKKTDQVETFIHENPYDLTDEELAIVETWKDFVSGSFMLMSYLKKYAVFYSQDMDVAFGVLALADDFATVAGTNLPIYVETVLLPFKGNIIYDGLISSYNVRFGSGASGNIKDAYQEAKAKHGVVTSLPFSREAKRDSDEDLLRFYLKNQRNREQYWDELWSLIRKKPALRLLYHHEMGKIHARTYKKRLRESGIEKGWFAILDANIVASGRMEAEAKTMMKAIVPSDRQAHVYIFQLG